MSPMFLHKVSRASFVRAVSAKNAARFVFSTWIKEKDAAKDFSESAYFIARNRLRNGEARARTAEVHSTFIKWHNIEGLPTTSYLYFDGGEQWYADADERFYICRAHDGRSYLAYYID